MPTTTIPTIDNQSVRHHLWGWSETIEPAVKALLFGHLYRLAVPVISTEHGYPSDLFHDAGWIDEYIEGPMEFGFSVSEFGTHIGTDDLAVLLRGHHDDTRIDYRIALERTGHGDWWVTITRLHGPEPKNKSGVPNDTNDIWGLAYASGSISREEYLKRQNEGEK